MAGKKKKEEGNITVEHVQTAVAKDCLPSLETIGSKLTDMGTIDKSSRYATFRWSVETIAKILGEGNRLENLETIGQWLVRQGKIDQNRPEIVLDWALESIISAFLESAEQNVAIKG